MHHTESTLTEEQVRRIVRDELARAETSALLDIHQVSARTGHTPTASSTSV